MSDNNKNDKKVSSANTTKSNSPNTVAANANTVDKSDRPSFAHIKADLKSALDDWDRWAENPDSEKIISPDEKQLSEMQKLLVELRKKMKAVGF